MCNLTDEERKIIQKFLLNSQMQGTVLTLPAAIDQLVTIIKKLEDYVETSDPTDNATVQ